MKTKGQIQAEEMLQEIKLLATESAAFVHPEDKQSTQEAIDWLEAFPDCPVLDVGKLCQPSLKCELRSAESSASKVIYCAVAAHHAMFVGGIWPCSMQALPDIEFLLHTAKRHHTRMKERSKNV